MLKARAALVDEEMNQAAEQAALEAAEVTDCGHVYTRACVRTFVFVRIHMHIWSILCAGWGWGVLTSPSLRVAFPVVFCYRIVREFRLEESLKSGGKLRKPRKWLLPRGSRTSVI
jgi:hypothetical protein